LSKGLLPRAPLVAPRALPDELVDVLLVLVIAAVDHDATLGLGDQRPLVLEPSERRPLHRGRVRGLRVDLDTPAETVDLVGVRRDVEAGVGQVPVVAEADLVDAITLLLRGCGPRGAGRAEVAVPVLLAGQIGAPRGVTHRAVVERAAGRAVGRERRVVLTDRTTEVDRGVAVHPPVELGVDLPPGAVGRLLDGDDGHAVGVEGLGDLLGGHRGGTLGVEHDRVDVLVVEHEQPARGPGRTLARREEVHAVVVHADLLGLLGSGVRGVLAPGRAGAEDRCAPRDEHLCHIALGHHEGVVLGHRHTGEAEQ